MLGNKIHCCPDNHLLELTNESLYKPVSQMKMDMSDSNFGTFEFTLQKRPFLKFSYLTSHDSNAH